MKYILNQTKGLQNFIFYISSKGLVNSFSTRQSHFLHLIYNNKIQDRKIMNTRLQKLLTNFLHTLYLQKGIQLSVLRFPDINTSLKYMKRLVFL